MLTDRDTRWDMLGFVLLLLLLELELMRRWGDEPYRTGVLCRTDTNQISRVRTGMGLFCLQSLWMRRLGHKFVALRLVNARG
ncbi:hypothetical protein BDV95DRAFT_209487 [Massariosphaeria phaeospora]|uniref:Secreted protein n=1 Tax=Massariosphaeria phaeospora TaxID=100035 RepID=A0A7C8I3Y1_9PLEO|nr:hypothetical protein BDV95DRAFT_209487 [Massariosphaeria phaeospora]